jgi:hypothetical protein
MDWRERIVVAPAVRQEILERASRLSAVEARALADRIRRQLAGRQHSDSVGLLAEDRSR